MLIRNRAEVVDQNFMELVAKNGLPSVSNIERESIYELDSSGLVDLFETQIISRQLDLAAREFRKRGLTYYTIGSSGHEGVAALAKALRKDDMAFLHYRDGAFFLQRSKQQPGSTPTYDMMRSFMAARDEPISEGRHKVLGSLDLNIPPQTSTIASHLPKAVGTALSIRRAEDLGIESSLPDDSIVYCSFGDASANHATALSAFNTASWCSFQGIPVPLMFVCEDNGIGISVPTPNGWISESFRSRPGLKYFYADGLDLRVAYRVASEAAHYIRTTRKPAFLHLRTTRLMGHAGSDVESTYLSDAQIEGNEAKDPLLRSARIVLDAGLMTSQEIIDLYQATRRRIERIGEEVTMRPKLLSIKDVAKSIVPETGLRKSPKALPEAKRQRLFEAQAMLMKQPQHMARLLNWALKDVMARYDNVVVFGEDVARKGGVYNVTSGLEKSFGRRRVFNSPLDETSVLGTAIGLAHNGFVPIPEIQFLAYVHNAQDQIRGEAATLSFFSAGQFQNPMVIRIAGLAYQKGFGGHFHNDNSVTVFRDLPGVIVACPSNGYDAATMLRECVRLAHEDGRVVIFLEPIALYMTKDLHDSGDGGWQFDYPDPKETCLLGEINTYGDGKDLAIVSYGNGYYLARQAAAKLEKQKNLKVRVIDMRWLSPLPTKKVIDAASGAKHVLVVEECRKTGAPAEELLSAMYLSGHKWEAVGLHAAYDCYIPLGEASTAGLPSCDSIFDAAVNLIKTKPDRQTPRRKLIGKE